MTNAEFLKHARRWFDDPLCGQTDMEIEFKEALDRLEKCEGEKAQFRAQAVIAEDQAEKAQFEISDAKWKRDEAIEIAKDSRSNVETLSRNLGIVVRQKTILEDAVLKNKLKGVRRDRFGIWEKD